MGAMLAVTPPGIQGQDNVRGGVAELGLQSLTTKRREVYNASARPGGYSGASNPTRSSAPGYVIPLGLLDGLRTSIFSIIHDSK